MADKKIYTTKDIRAEKAEQSKKNKSNGGENVVVKVNETVNVEFTEDFGKFIKKGHKQRMSMYSFEVYKKNGVAKKID